MKAMKKTRKIMKKRKKTKKRKTRALVRSSGRAVSTPMTSRTASKTTKRTAKKTTSPILKKIVVGELGSLLLIINKMRPSDEPIQ